MKEKISVKNFVEEFKTKGIKNTQINPTAVEEYILKAVEFTPYIPFIEKRELCTKVLEGACTTVGSIVEVDSVSRYLLFTISIINKYTNLTFISINRKRPKWETIVFYKYVKCASDYASVPWITEWKKINFKNWKQYIPIPRILHKLHTRKYEFNEKYFVMVDFI